MKFCSASPSFVLCVLCVSAFSFSLSAYAQSSPAAPRPITIDDYFQIQTVHDPQLSPDAQWVAYVVDKSSLKTDKSNIDRHVRPLLGPKRVGSLTRLDIEKFQIDIASGKTAADVPTEQDLLSYLPGNVFPVCPSGGTYTIGAVGAPPSTEMREPVM